MTVVPLRRPALKPVDRAPMPATRVLSTDARLAFSSLEGRLNALRRQFSGSFCTESQAAEIGRLCEEIKLEAQRLYRLTR